MDLKAISLDPIRRKKVAVLGYGKQGQAHALNLRDSGVTVFVGGREGKGLELAKKEGFSPLSIEEAVEKADIVMFLYPDHVIPEAYGSLQEKLKSGKKIVGLAHGYVYCFKKIPIFPECSYFLAAPKGAGALLRSGFLKGGGLPGAYAVEERAPKEFTELVLSYAKAIGIASSCLLKTTFEEETIGDLFGEQAVLTGGLMSLMESAFEVLVKNGHQPETAFFDVWYEAKLILDLWMKYGPAEFANRISHPAFYGGVTRGRELINEETKQKMEKIFLDIKSGKFADEWEKEVQKGMPTLERKKRELKDSLLQKTYQVLASHLEK